MKRARVPLGTAGPRGVFGSCPQGTREALAPVPLLFKPLSTSSSPSDWGRGEASSWWPILHPPQRWDTFSHLCGGHALPVSEAEVRGGPHTSSALYTFP